MKYAILLALLAAGCARFGERIYLDRKVTSGVVAGTTTQDEVKSILGLPTAISYTDTGLEVWTYRNLQGGYFFIASVARDETISFLFTEDGTVKKWGRSHWSGIAAIVPAW